MLIQMPRGAEQPKKAERADGVTAFEGGLRRDLSSDALILCDHVVGGVAKRAVDLALTLTLLPIWAPVLALGFALAKHRNTAAEACSVRDVVGYGGRGFRVYTLRLQRRSATVTQLNVGGGEAMVPEPREPTISRSKVQTAWEHVPLLWNVLRGDLSLVGPAPLVREDLDRLRGAKRHYFSARPGLFDVQAAVGEGDARYKAYALSWTLTDDAAILWDAIRSFACES